MTEYFIDHVYGDDESGSGTSEADPWRTFDNVNAGSLDAGDKVRLKAGLTFRDELVLPDSGNTDAQITITSYGSGTDPIISGSDRARGFALGTNLITNPSFEDWTSTNPDDWYVDEPGSSSIEEETTDVAHLTSACAIVCDSGGNAPDVYCDEIALDDNKKYRLSFWHKDPVAPEGDEAYLAVLVWRTDSTGGKKTSAEYYLDGTWSATAPSHLNGTAMESRAWWTQFYIDIDTGPNSNSKQYYHFMLRPYNVSPYNNYTDRTFLVDGCYLGLITSTGGEEVEDGSFENWTSTVLDDWTEEIGESGSDISQNTSDPYVGDSAVDMLVDDAGSGTISCRIYQDLANSFSDNSTYQVSMTHKIDVATEVEYAVPAVVIWRSGGSGQMEYLRADGAWSEADFSGYPLQQAEAGTYRTDTFTFETGANADGHTAYHVAVQPFQPTGVGYHFKYDTAGKTFTFDALSINKVVLPEGNVLTNWSFEDWTGATCDDWTLVQEGSTSIEKYNESRHGNWGLYLKIDADDSDVGIKQTGISLDASTTYRCGCFAHVHEQTGANNIELAIQVKRESDGFYWDGSLSSPDWVSYEADVTTGKPTDWGLVTDEFTTDSGPEAAYTFYIHRAEGTKQAAREEIYFDAAFIQAKSASDEVWAIPFPEEPKYVWATGTIEAEYANHAKLENESQTSKQTGTHHPHFLGWSYDRTDELLYINVAGDPGGITFECAVRDTCVDINGQSWVTVDGIQCYRPKKYGVDLSYLTVGTRPTELHVEDCTIKYTGSTAIIAGFQPPDAYEGGVTESEGNITPSEIYIERNDIERFGEWGKNRVRIAVDEQLTDPSFELWDSAAELTEWDDLPTGGGTFAQETTDTWIGDYSCVLTTDSVGSCPSVQQDDLYGLFVDSSETTGRVSLWYKTPDWDGATAAESVFAIIVRRYDSSGAATGQILDPDGTWDGANNGLPLAQSLTWTSHEFEFDRPADYEDYPIYSVDISIYAPLKEFSPSMRLFFDQASLSHGWTDWYTASSYTSSDCGIRVAADSLLDGGAGSVEIRNNKVDGKQGNINYSMGRNGIVVRNGGGSESLSGTVGGLILELTLSRCTWKRTKLHGRAIVSL
jgi:hypothetical protein